ncbi:MAG: dephospho-CoA kinase [Polyangiales bacterium]|nr:dephospho-CoA kinase [Myxococcales bacterium]
MATPTVGLTGGIASGKSSVARLFAELGVPVVDADQVARDVVKKGTSGYREVVTAFGAEVLRDDGELDRAKLGERVFADAAARGRLNAITHPRIAAESASRIAAAAKPGTPYVMYEAALLVENGLAGMFPALVVVTAPPELQLSRLIARDGFSEGEARARIAAQLPTEKKVAVATHVIENAGSIHELRERVREVHEAILASLRSS